MSVIRIFRQRIAAVETTVQWLLLQKVERILVSMPKLKSNFWATLPGVLTGVAALITAVGGILVASGVLKKGPEQHGDNGPRVFRTKSGDASWEREPDGVWVEEAIEHAGVPWTWRELKRNHDYIYLVDRSRLKNGNPNNPTLLRLPVKGGVVQWSWSEPEEWFDLKVVTAEP